MNTKLTSLVVLGAIAICSPAFAAKTSTPAPAKGAKIVAAKSKIKAAPLKNKKAVLTLKKAAK